MQTVGYFASSSILISKIRPGVVSPIRLTWKLPSPVLEGETITINMPGFTRKVNISNHGPQNIPMTEVYSRDATAFFVPTWNPLTQQIVMTCKLSMPAGLLVVAQVRWCWCCWCCCCCYCC